MDDCALVVHLRITTTKKTYEYFMSSYVVIFPFGRSKAFYICFMYLLLHKIFYFLQEHKLLIYCLRQLHLTKPRPPNFDSFLFTVRTQVRLLGTSSILIKSDLHCFIWFLLNKQSNTPILSIQHCLGKVFFYLKKY